MPRNEEHGPGDGLMQVGEDLDIKDVKLDSFDNITKALEHLFAAVVSGKATRYQIEAVDRIIDKAGRTLQAKAAYQKVLEALNDQGYKLGEDGRVIQLPSAPTGTPFRRKVG